MTVNLSRREEGHYDSPMMNVTDACTTPLGRHDAIVKTLRWRLGGII